MNIIIFDRTELTPAGTLVLSGDRARHLRETLKVSVGSVLRAAEINGSIGSGRVVRVSEGSVELAPVIQAIQSVSSEKRSSVVSELILALPRPQMLKRIYQTVAMMGVERLTLIRSERVEKSYFHSPLLRREERERYLREGMEQGVQTKLPEVRVLDQIKGVFTEHIVSCSSEYPVCLVADGSGSEDLGTLQSSSSFCSGAGCCLAIGPEGGWIERELMRFKEAGFVVVSLGSAVLKVENAVSVALGQLELVRNIVDRQESDRNGRNGGE